MAQKLKTVKFDTFSDVKKANDAIIAKKGHSVAVKVNINVTPINAKKSMADVEKNVAEAY